MKEMLAALLLRAAERHEASFDHARAEDLHRKVDAQEIAYADFETCYKLGLAETCHSVSDDLGQVLYLLLRHSRNDALEWATDTLQGYPKSSAGGLARKSLPLGGYDPSLPLQVVAHYNNGYTAEFTVEVRHVTILARWLEQDGLIYSYTVFWPVTQKHVTPKDLNNSDTYAKWLIKENQE